MVIGFRIIGTEKIEEATYFLLWLEIVLIKVTMSLKISISSFNPLFFGVIEIPPYMQHVTWQDSEYGCKGIQFKSIDDVSKMADLDGHEDSSGGQQ